MISLETRTAPKAVIHSNQMVGKKHIAKQSPLPRFGNENGSGDVVITMAKPGKAPPLAKLYQIAFELYDVPESKQKDFIDTTIGSARKFLSAEDGSLQKALESGEASETFFKDLSGAGYKPANSPDVRTIIDNALVKIKNEIETFGGKYLVSLESDGFAARRTKQSGRGMLKKIFAALDSKDVDKFQAKLKSLIQVAFTKSTNNAATDKPFDEAVDSAISDAVTEIKDRLCTVTVPNKQAVSGTVISIVNNFIGNMEKQGHKLTDKLDVQTFSVKSADLATFTLPKLYKAFKEDAKFSIPERIPKTLALTQIDSNIKALMEMALKPSDEIKDIVDGKVSPDQHGRFSHPPQGWKGYASQIAITTISSTISVLALLGLFGGNNNEKPEPPPATIEQPVDGNTQIPVIILPEADGQGIITPIFQDGEAAETNNDQSSLNFRLQQNIEEPDAQLAKAKVVDLLKVNS